MMCIEIYTSRRLQSSPAEEEAELLVDVSKSLIRGPLGGYVRGINCKDGDKRIPFKDEVGKAETGG